MSSHLVDDKETSLGLEVKSKAMLWLSAESSDFALGKSGSWGLIPNRAAPLERHEKGCGFD